MSQRNKKAKKFTGTSISMKEMGSFLKREHRFYGLYEEKKASPTITPAGVLEGATWEHADFAGKTEGAQPLNIEEATTLYMIVAGDDQTPCRWNGRQLTVEWLDDNGVPLFTKEQAMYLINCTYNFFESVGRTAKPILRPVPVFQIQTI